MSDEMVVVRGVLGWGNRKGGLEAYGPGGRWNGEGHYGDHGDLLGDALERAGCTEGADLVVLVVSRSMRMEDNEATEKLMERLGLEAAARPDPRGIQ